MVKKMGFEPKSKVIQIQRRLWTENKLGFNPVRHCCCGAELEIDASVGIEEMADRLVQFHDEHEQCLPGERV
jgi:hypothetical protein